MNPAGRFWLAALAPDLERKTEVRAKVQVAKVKVNEIRRLRMLFS